MTVVNKRTHKPTPNDVYIGRGSIWSNPFRIREHQTREHVVERYAYMMHQRLNPHAPNSNKWKERLLALKGKNLVCYCAPLICHGDVLEKLMEEMECSSQEQDIDHQS